jgi:hypothetical protein
LDDSDEVYDLDGLDDNDPRNDAGGRNVVPEELEEEDDNDDSENEEVVDGNFKGIYINDDPNNKYTDPETGAHFEYFDFCKRLVKLQKLRKQIDTQLGIIPTEPSSKEGNDKKTFNFGE